MPVLVSLDEARDIVVIIYGIIGIVFFFFALIIVIVVGLSARSLLKTVRGLLDENVKPALSSVKDAADTVRGTTEFVGKNAITPVVKAYGTFAGVKKGLGVFTKIKARGK